VQGGQVAGHDYLAVGDAAVLPLVQVIASQVLALLDDRQHEARGLCGQGGLGRDHDDRRRGTL
jgi:hypothetical protein